MDMTHCQGCLSANCILPGQGVVGFSETQEAHSSLADDSMGKIVGQKVFLTVTLMYSVII